MRVQGSHYDIPRGDEYVAAELPRGKRTFKFSMFDRPMPPPAPSAEPTVPMAEPAPVPVAAESA